jgi:hypothetical protein
MEGGLGDPGHGQMPVADIQVEGAGAVPAQRMVEFEELFDRPALRVVPGQDGDFGPVGGAEETLIVKIFFTEAVALNEFMIKRLRFGLEMVIRAGGGVAGPMLGEPVRREFVSALAGRGVGWQGAEQVKAPWSCTAAKSSWQ